MNRIIYTFLIMLAIPKIYGQDKYLNPSIDFGDEIEQINKYNKDLERTISKFAT
jgi:hypothetical protein